MYCTCREELGREDRAPDRYNPPWTLVSSGGFLTDPAEIINDTRSSIIMVVLCGTGDELRVMYICNSWAYNVIERRILTLFSQSLAVDTLHAKDANYILG